MSMIRPPAGASRSHLSLAALLSLIGVGPGEAFRPAHMKMLDTRKKRRSVGTPGGGLRRRMTAKLFRRLHKRGLLPPEAIR